MVEQVVDADNFTRMVRKTQQKAHTPHVQRERFTIA
jgi:hypothetical protein